MKVKILSDLQCGHGQHTLYAIPFRDINRSFWNKPILCSTVNFIMAKKPTMRETTMSTGMN